MTEDISAEKMAKILRQVRALLDRAEHPNTPAGEAETCRAKAEQFMRDYRIEEEQAIAADPQSLKPVSQSIVVTDSEEFGQWYYTILAWIGQHTGVRVRGVWAWDPQEKKSVIRATVVGYESDLRIAELLFTNARLAFSGHLEPAVDPTLTDQVNAYRLRVAGMERNRIAKLMWGSAMDDGKAHGKVGALYKAECAARGEEAALSGRGVNAKLYRKSYAEGFAYRIYDRLKRARDAADRVGGLPALHGRQERVDEAFYELFPDARPVPAGNTPKAVKPGKAGRLSKKEVAAMARASRPEARAARRAGTDAADSVAIDGQQGQRLEEGMGTWSDRAWQELGQ